MEENQEDLDELPKGISRYCMGYRIWISSRGHPIVSYFSRAHHGDHETALERATECLERLRAHIEEAETVPGPEGNYRTHSNMTLEIAEDIIGEYNGDFV